jgi:DNA-binding transcriptional regulator LsrR (DeoR family)
VKAAKKAGAVGEICLRYVDAAGTPVHTELDDLTIGVTLEQLRRAKRRWAVVGGAGKREAIRAVLAGNWIDVLVTDRATAHHLAAADA